jgi:hypothetical protein
VGPAAGSRTPGEEVCTPPRRTAGQSWRKGRSPALAVGRARALTDQVAHSGSVGANLGHFRASRCERRSDRGTWPAVPKTLVRGAQSSMCASIRSQGNLVTQDYAFASIRMCGMNTLTGARVSQGNARADACRTTIASPRLTVRDLDQARRNKEAYLLQLCSEPVDVVL